MRGSTCTSRGSPGPAAEARRSIKLLPGKTYVRPSGYKVRMEKPGATAPGGWSARSRKALLCHKPCTVSGGGKSEISKPITDAILTGPVFVADFKNDFDQVAELIDRDYSGRFKDSARQDKRADSQRGTLARLGHQTAHAGRTGLHGRNTTPGWRASRSTSRNWCSS